MFLRKYNMTNSNEIISTFLHIILFINVRGITLSDAILSIRTLYIGIPLKFIMLYKSLRWRIIAIISLGNVSLGC